MVVRCDKYPQLVVNDLKVKFKDGVAEVKNKKTLSKLLSMKGYGFIADDAIVDDGDDDETEGGGVGDDIDEDTNPDDGDDDETEGDA